MIYTRITHAATNVFTAEIVRTPDVEGGAATVLHTATRTTAIRAFRAALAGSRLNLKLVVTLDLPRGRGETRSTALKLVTTADAGGAA